MQRPIAPATAVLDVHPSPTRAEGLTWRSALAGRIYEALEGGDDLVVDCSELGEMEIPTIALFMRLTRDARGTGQRLTLAACHPTQREIFLLAQLRGALEVA